MRERLLGLEGVSSSPSDLLYVNSTIDVRGLALSVAETLRGEELAVRVDHWVENDDDSPHTGQYRRVEFEVSNQS